MAKRCATYVMVEPERLKIGHSIAVERRARQVAPYVDWSMSLGAIFSSPIEAMDCERAMHWVFREHRLKPMPNAGDSGTEYFAPHCLLAITEFIDTHAGSAEIKRGEDLRAWFEPAGPERSVRELRRRRNKFYERLSRDPRRGQSFWWLYDNHDAILDSARADGIGWKLLLEEVNSLGLTNAVGRPVANRDALRATFNCVRALKKRDAEWLAKQKKKP